MTAAPALAQSDAQPQEGAETVVRTMLEGFASGEPDYATMSTELARTARQQRRQIQRLMRALGPIESITFTGVRDGVDIFDVDLANGSLEFFIDLDEEGIATTATFHPTSLPEDLQ